MNEPIEWQDGLGRTWWQPRSEDGTAYCVDSGPNGTGWRERFWVTDYSVFDMEPKRYRSKWWAKQVARWHDRKYGKETFYLVKENPND